MTAGSIPPASAAGVAVFDVERFEWTAPDRVEVAGHWSGVRGVRFMRPTLTMPGDGQRRRLLAVLDHKPWAAEDGELWIAAFPWEGEPVDVEGAELAVAPSIAVTLPAPRAPGGKRKRTPPQKAPRFERATAHNPELLERARDAAVIERAALERERDRAVRDRDAALAQLRERDDDARLAELRDALDAARAEADAQRARAEDLAARLATSGDAASDADALRTHAEELARRAQRADAVSDAARAALTAAREEAEAERRRVDEIRARAQAAEAARDKLAREREAIRHGARDALARVDAAEAAVASIAAERDEALAAREAALAAGDRAPAAPAEPEPIRLAAPIAPPVRRARRRDVASWGPRLAALGALLFLIVVLALLVRGV